MTIFEIEKELRTLLNQMEFEAEETGEINESLFLKIKQLEIDREKKREGLALYVKELKGQESFISNEMDKLKKKKDSIQREMEYLKNLLIFDLEGKKFKTPLVSCFYRNTSSVAIDNEELVPDEYKTQVIETKISKEAIKKDLVSGKEISGVTLTEKTSLIIR